MPFAIALLTSSVMLSAVGIFFGLIALPLTLMRKRPREAPWLVPVAIVFAAWFLAFDRAHPAASGSGSTLLQLPLYTLWGLGASAAGLVGEGGWIGLPILALAAGAVGYAWWRGGSDPLTLGVAVALVMFYAVTGLARGQIGYDQSGAGRYVYVGAVFWLILLSRPAGRLPWRGTWRPVLVALVFLACFNSAAVLFEFGTAKAAQAHQMRLVAAELAPMGVRVNGVSPDAVIQGSKLFAGDWGRDRAAKYGVPQEKLGEYYAQRSLLKLEILPEDIANAVFALVGGLLGKTTGVIIPVDGGVAAGFLR
jgi:NAD(P)-dependent dehydrogenase (short-subunit alcohol dehydrogenase family)